MAGMALIPAALSGYAKESLHAKKHDFAQINAAALGALMAGTRAFPVEGGRKKAITLMQSMCDKLTGREFLKYRAQLEYSIRKGKRTEYPILEFLENSLDAVIADVAASRVKFGEMKIWHVYNMGYIFKTPSRTFAVDVCHPSAAKLAPLIDFLLVTHNHIDHYDNPLIYAMGAKPVVSNFVENRFMVPEGGRFEFGGIKITATPVDHNAHLVNFVLAFEIDCGKDTGNCTVYHVGDACNIKQLKPSEPPNIFIPHLAVGLDTVKCQTENVRPEYILLSHILELGHEMDKWRWPIKLGLDTCNSYKISKHALPLWGDSFLWQNNALENLPHI